MGTFMAFSSADSNDNIKVLDDDEGVGYKSEVDSNGDDGDEDENDCDEDGDEDDRDTFEGQWAVW